MIVDEPQGLPNSVPPIAAVTAPKLAIVVRVDEVFLHCAKAFRRSRLWDPGHFQDRREMPSLVKIILDQTTGAPSDDAEMRKLDEELEDDYKKSMY